MVESDMASELMEPVMDDVLAWKLDMLAELVGDTAELELDDDIIELVGNIDNTAVLGMLSLRVTTPGDLLPVLVVTWSLSLSSTLLWGLCGAWFDLDCPRLA